MVIFTFRGSLASQKPNETITGKCYEPQLLEMNRSLKTKASFGKPNKEMLETNGWNILLIRHHLFWPPFGSIHAIQYIWPPLHWIRRNRKYDHLMNRPQRWVTFLLGNTPSSKKEGWRCWIYFVWHTHSPFLVKKNHNLRTYRKIFKAILKICFKIGPTEWKAQRSELSSHIVSYKINIHIIRPPSQYREKQTSCASPDSQREIKMWLNIGTFPMGDNWVYFWTCQSSNFDATFIPYVDTYVNLEKISQESLRRDDSLVKFKLNPLSFLSCAEFAGIRGIWNYPNVKINYAAHPRSE
jgi:hypothetical protein